MWKKMTGGLWAMLTVLAVAGCSTSAPLVNVSQTPITWVGPTGSLEQVDTAIKRALIAKGWTGETVAPGKIRGSILVRGKHTAVVEIPFSNHEYEIKYASSTGLDYNATKETIHRNYNKWVLSLNQEIKAKLGNLQPKPAAAG